MTQDLPSPLTQTAADPGASTEQRLHALEAQVALLEEATRQATLLFEHLPTPALLLDAQGRVVSGNLRSYELLGASPGTLLGRRFAFFLHSASQGTFTALLDRAQQSGERLRGEVQLQADDGAPQEMLLEVSPHEGQWLLTLTDVTPFKEAHRRLMDTAHLQEEQLRDVNLGLRQLAEEFEAVMRLSEQHLHHRLTRAGNFLALYRQEAQPRYLGHVEAALDQTQNLLESLEQYMQMRFMRTRMRRVNLEQVWRDVVKEAKRELAGRDVQLTGAALPVLEGDSQVFKLILAEYLFNALKFTRTREHTRLQLLVEETGTEYRIGVQDNGVGFNMRQKERAFELFGRLHADEQYEGTGLGLAVVRRLCERFGQRAWGEGKVDEGATFWFSWPKVLKEG